MSNIDKHAVQAVADLKAGYTLGRADVAILNELARIALASLEAEAVAWLLSGGGAKNHVSFDSGNAYADPLREVTPLYTAPPAPVSVPDEDLLHMAASAIDDLLSNKDRSGAGVWADIPAKLRRAAMLQGSDGTLTNEGTIPVTQFKPVADLYGLTSPTGGETSFTFDAVEARDFVDGGWSCQEYVELERFQEAVSGNSPVIQGCSCLTCRPVTFSDSRFVVCPECGNKRCPHANDHRNACTGSNEPGQEGSAYPAAPQQEVESQIRKGKTVAREEWELGARLTKHRFKP
ncbi:hypothetical protein ABKU22_16360 [Enterobacter roggenkampii]|uniref:hypothetical protein n=1 Tax=Enterobacter roggenkampii TaxID=1812935 RepID=UPI0032AF682B